MDCSKPEFPWLLRLLQVWWILTQRRTFHMQFLSTKLANPTPDEKNITMIQSTNINEIEIIGAWNSP